MTYMLNDPEVIAPSFDLVLVSRHLERVGDHATNIAEDIIFLVEGRDVRHQTSRFVS
jgi:phosphate transport system protein